MTESPPPSTASLLTHYARVVPVDLDMSVSGRVVLEPHRSGGDVAPAENWQRSPSSFPAGGGKRGGRRGEGERRREVMSGRGKYHTALNFLQVFNFANFPPFTKYLDKNFELRHTHCSCSDCRSVNGQYPGAKLPNPQEVLCKEVSSR